MTPAPPLPSPTSERMKEKTIQPTTSLKMAAAMITVPISVFSSFMSSRILAITGRAEIDMAVPRKRAKSEMRRAAVLHRKPLRKQPGQTESGGERQDHAADAGREGNPAMPEKQGKAQFETGNEEEQDHRQRKDRIEGHREIGVAGKGKNRVVGRRRDSAEDGRAEGDPDQQFAHDHRQADFFPDLRGRCGTESAWC